MKLLNFINALLPHLDKAKILEDLRVTLAELENVVIPSYDAAATQFKVIKIKAEVNRNLSNTFYQNFDLMRQSKQATFVGDIQKRLTNVKGNTEYVLGLIEELFERDIINEGLTAKKAILLRASSNFSFISRYATDLLNMVCVDEAIERNESIADELRLSPIAMKHIAVNFKRFSLLLSEYSVPTDTFSKLIVGIPEVVINNKTSNAVSGIYKEGDVDPFLNSYVSGFVGNPIYHVRLLVAEWQSNRYKANKDKKKMLELRLLHLKMLDQGKSDPKIEQEINYIQNRVDKISQYLTEVEESLDTE